MKTSTSIRSAAIAAMTLSTGFRIRPESDEAFNARQIVGHDYKYKGPPLIFKSPSKLSKTARRMSHIAKMMSVKPKGKDSK